ncbi:unnamed protein product [Adineta steineri]|uniref:Peptidase S53 domain-containing protein n=1 Tax=Adineta steineri TaxID=433720 RepID=A0A814M8A8_9BILA|nr:unnamed protein product [Adineta steineri]CAF4040881.1 unnamed protein product [Adineta steineri]
MSTTYQKVEDTSELHEMMMDSQQSRTVTGTAASKRLSNQWRSRISCTMLVLLFIVGGAIMALISYHAVQSNSVSSAKEQSDIAVSSDWNEKEKTEMKYDVSKEDISQQLAMSNDDNSIKNDDDHAPQLRSYVGHHNPRSPQRIGHTNIYIDKNARRGNSRHNERLRFPVVQYDRNRIPFRGPFINFMPRVPIFADRRTKQTLIFSPTGGVYIIPPLINFYGQMFSIAELIASGYASLVSSGVPPTSNLNMMPFFLPQPLIGSGIPRVNPRTGGFTGGIRTKYGSFSTSKHYRTQNNVDATVETEEEEEENDDASDDNNNNDNYRYQSVSDKNHKRPRNDDKKPSKNHKRLRNNYRKTTKNHERPTRNYQRSTATSTATTPTTTIPTPTETATPDTELCQASISPGQAPFWLSPSSDSSDPDTSITFFLALKQNSEAVEKLERIFWKITDPDSSEYQKWLTRTEINKILTLDSKILARVKRFLQKQSFTSVQLIGTDVFAIMTTIRQASDFFSAQFRPYKNTKTGRTMHLTDGEMCLTDEISQYVDFWFDFYDDAFTNNILTNPSKKRIIVPDDGNDTDTTTTQIHPMVVPQFVISYYNIPNVLKTGLESNVSQASLQFEGQYYSEKDLQKYSQEVNIPFKPLKTNHILGIDDQSQSGIESMLDVEQMVGINPLAETWYLNDDVKNISSDGFLVKILTINELKNIPQILSISYGGSEEGMCAGVINCDEKVVYLNKRYYIRANIEFMKLTIRGITVLVASGDDGVNDYYADCTNTIFNPEFPNTSPFITSVGATTLVNVQYNALQDQPPVCTDRGPLYPCVSGGDETAVSVNGQPFNLFTSGGGFSNIFSQPSYQKDSINDYFRNEQHYLNKTPEYYPPSSMYNRYGRAYPDVAALGVRALTVINDTNYLYGGTSMSSPLWAGIVSILNSRSIQITGKTLGFLNPLLYKMAKECPECFKDITVGNNKCTQTVCTDQCRGFQAACGWDPVTGLGTPNVGNMLQYITKLLEKKMKKTEYN